MNKPKCERCTKYGITTEMQLRKLEPKEVKDKMAKSRIRGYPYGFVYLFYNYFECPVCHWFKFKKKEGIGTVKIDGYDY